MSDKQEKNEKRSYATAKDGINYRDIADNMTMAGHVMNHSSARNYILRVMLKFAGALNSKLQLGLTENQLKEISHSSRFQATIIDLLKDVLDKK